jgi:putative phosphoribosyl transferase
VTGDRSSTIPDEQHNSNRITERSVQIPADEAKLSGDLVLPDSAVGIVIFVHGSGSSRQSPRNRYVAQVLQQARLGTLLFDLLTEEEEQIDLRTAALRFDIRLLAHRLVLATQWILEQEGTRSLPIGYFGASTGAAAALVASAELPASVKAIVSRGGRPDLAGQALRYAVAPALLIVGGADTQVLELNRIALEKLRGIKELVIVPGASHLFEESGALETVARVARDWFVRYLSIKRENLEAA